VLALSADVALALGRRPVPTATFRQDACPSAFAPASCAGATADTCQEAFVVGGAAEGCTVGHGNRAVRFVPEDAPADGGTSRSWSFATRPQQRHFYSSYPEATGSVRITTDGLGTAGSTAGAADEAHIRLSIRPYTRRLVVLRWFTGGLPPGAQAKIRLTRGQQIVFEATEDAGPPVKRTRITPVTWRGDLDLTVSAVVTGPRDHAIPSADLLWDLAVIERKSDPDHDGVRSRRDPDPFDPNVPRTPLPSRRPKVLVVGLDAAGWDVLQPLMDAGYLPVIKQLVDAGVQAPMDETPADTTPSSCCYCPPIWSSIMTGQPLQLHQMAAVLSEPWDRPVPSVASVLADRGGTTTEVSYRNTFPAEPGTRYDFTEEGLDVVAKDLFTAWGLDLDERGEWSNRLQLTWPPRLFETTGVLPATGPQIDAWNALARDRVSAIALARLAAMDQTDLTMWILHSIDKTEHIVWTGVQRMPDAPLNLTHLLQEAGAWTGPVEGGVWVYGSVASQNLEADLHIGELLGNVSYDYVMLVSDHAMTYNANFPHPPLAGVHIFPAAYNGIFALRGPGVVGGQSLAGVSVLDVAPTLAYLLNLPIAANLPGRVVTEAFTPSFLASHPIRTVPTW